ncbi:MAG TPA: DNA polymerase IV [Candidatus Thermoplasmatota archaeon]|nr:DNA polymerase IV [Candidatus Thermoplasmatota archaeon]
MVRYIVHVDLDAFYASVEELDHPEYKGAPLVVGADPKQGSGRGVVTTANYEARKFGIRSAMPIGEAYRRCPHARFVYPRFERYAEKSDEVFAILRDATDMIEPGGIDEGWLDLSSRVRSFVEAVEYARALQTRILVETGLTASMGVASNKVVAKIATDMRKPAGLTPVPPGTEREFLAPLAVRKIPGVGPKSEEHLKGMGIETVAQLAAVPPVALQREFGAWGPRLWSLAQGIDEAPVETGWERKSVGGETTFLEDTTDETEWRATIEELARDAARHLVEEGTLARTVTLKVRLTGFETYTRARTLAAPTDDGALLGRVALDLLSENRPTRAVRLLGVRLSHLIPREGTQLLLDEWDVARFGEAPPWRPKQTRLDI